MGGFLLLLLLLLADFFCYYFLTISIFLFEVFRLKGGFCYYFFVETMLFYDLEFDYYTFGFGLLRVCFRLSEEWTTFYFSFSLS